MGLRHLPLTLTALLTAIGGLAITAPSASAIADRDCGDFASQRAAQIFFLNQGGPQSDPHGLDGSDNDGRACESNPAPYYYGTTPPGGGSGGSGSGPKTKTVRTSVKLVLDRARAIRGESVRLTATVTPRGTRKVVFQQRVGRRWKVVERDSSNRRGKATHGIRSPRSASTYRAVVAARKAGNKRFTGAVSAGRRLQVQKQSVRLRLSRSSVDQHASVTAKVDVTPVRTGRTVSLEVLRDGRWRTFRTGRQDRAGHEVFSVPTADAGSHRYRATTHRARGAAAQRSHDRRLRVDDVTAPSVPRGLVAAPGEGTVDLTWTRVGAADLARYDVRVRSSSGVTQVVNGSASPSLVVGTLSPGETYEFAVRSVDTSDNRSAYSTDVAATLPE